jgi:hypothetical protein
MQDAPVETKFEAESASSPKICTVGCSENIIEASWQALVDSVEYKLLKDNV